MSTAMSEAFAGAKANVGAAKSVTLNELAREAVQETTTTEEGIKSLLAKVKGRKDLMQQLLIAGARDYISVTRTKLRDAIDHEYLDARERGLKRHSAALNGRATLFDWKLPVTGKPLGDATTKDLGDAVDFHAGRAEFESGRAKMYRVVMEHLARSNAATVREGIGENDLAKIMKDVDVEQDA